VGVVEHPPAATLDFPLCNDPQTYKQYQRHNFAAQVDEATLAAAAAAAVGAGTAAAAPAHAAAAADAGEGGHAVIDVGETADGTRKQQQQQGVKRVAVSPEAKTVDVEAGEGVLGGGGGGEGDGGCWASMPVGHGLVREVHHARAFDGSLHHTTRNHSSQC